MTSKRKRIIRPRVEIYLSPEEREMWDRAVSMADKYDSLSSMVRDLVGRYYRQQLKKAAKDCPE